MRSEVKYGRSLFNGMKRKLALWVWFMYCLSTIAAQTGSEYEIRWIGQFPPLKEDQKTTFSRRVSDLIFGRMPHEVIKPFGIVAEHPRNFLILDQGAGTVFECNEGVAHELKSIKKAAREFPSLVGICRMPGGDLLCTDSRKNLVFRISEKGLSPVSGSVSFDQPTGIAYCNTRQEIWVVETGAHRICVLDREGELVKYIGERGSASGAFNYPTFIWIDQDGRVYIVDSMNFRVQVFDQQGTSLFSFGESGDATGNLARPKGVATDSEGNIYVADALFHVIQIFDGEGHYLYNFGKQGQGEGEFWMPAGIYIDEQDRIYVADSYNGRIQIFERIKTGLP
jgi:hypothetical protein